MAQHDLNIANQTAASARADINNALSALGSNNSGGSAPSTTYSNMTWYDTSANLLRIRNEADSAWITIGYVNQSGGVFNIIDNTEVVTTGGTAAGLLGDQTASTWTTGTGTTESLVSPAKMKAAILANAASGYAQPTSIDAVGTYAWLMRIATGQYDYINQGASIAGGDLRFSGITKSIGNAIFNGIGTQPSGTWRAMGVMQTGFGGYNLRMCLFLRIA